MGGDSAYWTPPQRWLGQTAVVVGGGPSLRDVDPETLRHANVIAVNNAYQIVPWADYLFFGDARWWRWHADQVTARFRGEVVTSSPTLPSVPGIKRLRKSGAFPIPPEADTVAGLDSGYMATLLAYRLGASRIVLAGMDMAFVDGRTHCHGGHPEPSREADYQRYRPAYASLLTALADEGVELVRMTPSDMTFIPQIVWAA